MQRVRARTLTRALFDVRAPKHKIPLCLSSHTPIQICIHMTPLPRTRPRTRTRRSQQFRTLSCRLMSAPAASSAVTTSMWPSSALSWRAVRPFCKQQAAREGKQECVRVCARVCARARMYIYIYIHLSIHPSIHLSPSLPLSLSPSLPLSLSMRESSVCVRALESARVFFAFARALSSHAYI